MVKTIKSYVLNCLTKSNVSGSKKVDISNTNFSLRVRGTCGIWRPSDCW